MESYLSPCHIFWVQDACSALYFLSLPYNLPHNPPKDTSKHAEPKAQTVPCLNNYFLQGLF